MRHSPTSILATLGTTPEQVRRSVAQAWPKHGSGRAPMPAHVVNAMFADYQRTKSLRKTASLYGRSWQSLQGVFKGHSLPLQPIGRRKAT